MIKVEKREDESFDDLLRRFKTASKKAGVMEECKRRKFFMTKAEKRAYKSKMARIRNKGRKRR